jgi:F0F1-type ATP synthase gamma subunit
MLLSVFNVVIRFSFAPSRQDFQFAHLIYKRFINLMNQNGQIDKTVPSEAKKPDAQRTRSLQHEIRKS